MKIVSQEMDGVARELHKRLKVIDDEHKDHANLANDALLGMESAKRGHLEGRRQALAPYTPDSLDIPVVGDFRLSFGRTRAPCLDSALVTAEEPTPSPMTSHNG